MSFTANDPPSPGQSLECEVTISRPSSCCSCSSSSDCNSSNCASGSSTRSASYTKRQLVIGRRPAQRLRHALKADVEQDEDKFESSSSSNRAWLKATAAASSTLLDGTYKTTSKRHSAHKRSRRHYPSRWTPLLLVPLLLTLLLPTVVVGSQGDRSPEYNDCVDACKLDSCFVAPDWDDGTARYTKLPFVLRLTGWNCVDDCKYHCTHRVTNEAHDRVTRIREESLRLVTQQAGTTGWTRAEQRRKVDELVAARLAQLRPVQKEMVQFHGKWVFIRFLGAQEPLSVLFSLLNLHVHLKAIAPLRKQISDNFPLKLVYILHALLSCVAWFWSAVFHTRDKNLTERMDYFSAGGVVLGGWFIAVCRLLRLSPDRSPFLLLARGCGIAYTLHILYLSIGRFDYGYNMKVNMLFGASHSLLWLTYSVNPSLFHTLTNKIDRFSPSRLPMSPSSPHMPNTAPLHSNGGSPPAPVSAPVALPPSSSRKQKKQLQKIIFLLVLATCLEIFDFPPLFRSLDAHALWHAATVPISSLWYSWLIEDARECTMTGYWLGEGLRFRKSETVENVSKVATDVVGTQVILALEKTVQVSKVAKEWVESAAGKSTSAFKGATGTSTGIEFKTLTHKLNEIASGAFGGEATPTFSTTTSSAPSNTGGGPSIRPTSLPHISTINTRAVDADLAGRSSGREREKLRELGTKAIV